MDPAFNLPTQFAPLTREGFQGDETQVIPRFYQFLKPMPAASQEAGRLVSKAVDMVDIYQAGETGVASREEVNITHKRRWPQHWAAYQEGKEQIASGTPIEQLFLGNPEVSAELKRYNVHTIQALLGIPDSAGDKIAFLADWKRKAEIYLKGTEKGKGFHELERQLATAAQENRELKESIALQKDRMDKLEAALAKKD